MRTITRNALIAALGIAAQTTAQAAPSASISFVTSDDVEPGETITIDVVCDYDTETTDAGLFGAPGLFLFACEAISVTGNATNDGSITINAAFPSLQVPGAYVSGGGVESIAGGVGSEPAATENPVTLFSFQQLISEDASDGDEIEFEYEGAVVFDAGGELYSIGSTGTNAYSLASSTSLLTVFVEPTSCNAADIGLPYEVLDLTDVNTFVNGFLSQDPIVDFDENGLFDLTDINTFITAFNLGCP